METKDIGTVILILTLIILAVFTYNLYSGATECKAIATDLGAKLQECGAGIEQYEAGLNECMAGVEVCQGALTSLKQIPACAPYIPE